MKMEPQTVNDMRLARASVIIPAHNEAGYIERCLKALLASRDVKLDVIVIANACSDDTAARTRRLAVTADQRNAELRVIQTPEGGKLNALNLGDAEADYDIRVYLDADVEVSPDLIAQLCEILDTDAPRYASGTPLIARADSWVSRAYARFWSKLPFVTYGVPGFGVFAMNSPMRARWGHWPDIISDDTFARLQARPEERVRVRATYSWPVIEGFGALVRVRRRQNDGVAEIAKRFSSLLAHDDTPTLPLSALPGQALRDPVGFVIYAAVTLSVKLPFFVSRSGWARGR